MRHTFTPLSPRWSRFSCLLLPGCLLFFLLFSFSACGSTQPASSPAAGSTPTLPPATPTPSVPTISQPLLTYSGHASPVIGASWSPDGTRIASCGNDGTVQAWNAQTGKLLWKATIGRYAFAVAWSPDGKEVAGGASDGSVALLNAANGKQFASYTHQKGFIEGIAWSPNSHFVAVGSQDSTVDVWNIQTGKIQVTYTSTNAVERIAWSPDGKKIASADYDGSVQIWDAMSGKHILTYSGNHAPVWDVAWSPDGTRIASGTGAAGNFQPVTSNNSLQIWDATTGKTLLTYTGIGGDVQTYALAWSPDGTRIASGGSDEFVHVWDASSGQTLLQYHGHHDIIFKVAWSPDGSLLASASADGTVQIWKPQV